MINHLINFLRVRWLILIYVSMNTTHKIPPYKCWGYGRSAGSLPAAVVPSGNGLGLLPFRPHISPPIDTTWLLQWPLPVQRLVAPKKKKPFKPMDFSPMLKFVPVLGRFSTCYFLISLQGVESLSDYGFRFNYSEITEEIESQVHSRLLHSPAQTLRESAKSFINLSSDYDNHCDGLSQSLLSLNNT